MAQARVHREDTSIWIQSHFAISAPIKVWIPSGLLGGWRERKSSGNTGLFSVCRYWDLTANFTIELLERGK